MTRRISETEERGVVSSMDPAELWRQWMESGSRMWSGGDGQMDPFGVYGRWFEGMREVQERMIGAAPEPVAGSPEVRDMWQRWFELSSDSWRKSAEMGQSAMDLLPRWMQMLDEARTNLLAGGAPPSDPLQLATQWYNATSGPFSDFVGDVIEDFEYGYAEPATTESVKELETRLDRVEGKLDRLLAALEGGTQDGGPQAETNGSGGEIRATDAARRKAREMGVDLTDVVGSGAGGQVTVEDVRKKGES